MKFLFVAEHPGPLKTLQTLQEAAPSHTEILWLTSGFNATRMPSGLEAIVRGSSETLTAMNTEDAAARWGNQRGIPVFAIEDFPLNYHPWTGEKAAGLFVEFEEEKARYAKRGISKNIISVTGNPRYSKEPLSKRRRENETPVVLWAGQPDSQFSFGTVKALLPILSRLKAKLLFRAHPRDDYYRTGRYRALLEKGKVAYEDVSAVAEMGAIYARCDLALTEYSTVALEAQCRGIPSVFVLLPKLGAASIQHFKGHDWIPWVDRRAAFCVRSRAALAPTLKIALYDKLARRLVLRRFEKILRFNSGAPQRIWGQIQRILGENTCSQPH